MTPIHGKECHIYNINRVVFNLIVLLKNVMYPKNRHRFIVNEQISHVQGKESQIVARNL